jgi:hypothetical protein
MTNFEIISLVVSSVALLIACITAYYQFFQRGNLRIYDPQSYYSGINDASFYVNINLTMYNDGAKTIVIQDLLLVLIKNERPPLAFRGISEKIDSWPDVRNRKPIILEPKKTMSLICCFEGPEEEGSAFQELHLGNPEVRLNSRIAIKAKLGNKKRWSNILRFSLKGVEKVKETWYTIG